LSQELKQLKKKAHTSNRLNKTKQRGGCPCERNTFDVMTQEEREQLFAKQRNDILASPLEKTDHEILIKIAKLSLNKGYCYQFQKVLALDILKDLGRGAVRTLQNHTYRLRDAKILLIKVNAGEQGQNHYRIDWDVLNSLPVDFRLSPFRKMTLPKPSLHGCLN